MWCWTPGHGREIVDGLNATGKWFLSMLISTVQLPGASDYESHTEIHTSNSNTDISLERKLKNIFQNQHRYMACCVMAST